MVDVRMAEESLKESRDCSDEVTDGGPFVSFTDLKLMLWYYF